MIGRAKTPADSHDGGTKFTSPYNETRTKMASHHPAIRRKTQQVATIAAGIYYCSAAELLRVVAEATELLCVCTKDELRAAFAGGADTSAATAARLDVVRGYVLVMDNFYVE
jgi:hypothetical protein